MLYHLALFKVGEWKVEDGPHGPQYHPPILHHINKTAHYKSHSNLIYNIANTITTHVTEGILGQMSVMGLVDENEVGSSRGTSW